MFSLTRIQLLKFAAASALVTLTAASTPARADEMIQNLGPVGPHEPILTMIGSERVIAFYVPDDAHCALSAVIWHNGDTDRAARVRISLNPHQIVRIEGVDNKSLNLQCGDNAQTLAIVDTDERIRPVE
jgi:hypothetical protein